MLFMSPLDRTEGSGVRVIKSVEVLVKRHQAEHLKTASDERHVGLQKDDKARQNSRILHKGRKRNDLRRRRRQRKDREVGGKRGNEEVNSWVFWKDLCNPGRVTRAGNRVCRDVHNKCVVDMTVALGTGRESLKCVKGCVHITFRVLRTGKQRFSRGVRLGVAVFPEGGCEKFL